MQKIVKILVTSVITLALALAPSAVFAADASAASCNNNSSANSYQGSSCSSNYVNGNSLSSCDSSNSGASNNGSSCNLGNSANNATANNSSCNTTGNNRNSYAGNSSNLSNMLGSYLGGNSVNVGSTGSSCSNDYVSLLQNLISQYLGNCNSNSSSNSNYDFSWLQSYYSNEQAVPVYSSNTNNTALGCTDEFASEVIRLVNVERAANGLNPLVADAGLCAAAAVRAQEIQLSFSHTRPDGSDCFTVLAELDVSYRTAGENIASGQATPAEVVAAWMNSEGHRENILNANFGRIGVASITNGSASQVGYAWAQLFAD